MHSIVINNKRYRVQAGFTLVEFMTSLSLASLLLLGSLDIMLTTTKAISRAQAQTGATTRATIAIARIADMSRECYSLALPTDSSGFSPPVSSTTAASYITTDGSAAALQLTAPSTGAITVVNSVGVNKTAGTNFPMTYAKAAGPSITIYRSNISGSPQPNTGQYIWEIGTPPGLSALATNGQCLAYLSDTTSISSNTPDALTFVRDIIASTTSPAVDIHILAADYSAINGSQSNESGSNQVTGKCVLLRNHP